jgi:hypothetical protein
VSESLRFISPDEWSLTRSIAFYFESGQPALDAARRETGKEYPPKLVVQWYLQQEQTFGAASLPRFVAAATKGPPP